MNCRERSFDMTRFRFDGALRIPGSLIPGSLALGLLALLLCSPKVLAQQSLRLLNSDCTPALDAPVTEPHTGRTYVLDYPCDLKPGEDVTFILNLHGGGSNTAYQHAYFPAWELKEKYRLVIATPYSPSRRWSEVDDEYLQNIIDAVTAAVGRQHLRAFWLAGHSQGGSTSRRLVCTPYFTDKVDGFLSLSGGRLGGAPERSPEAGRPRQLTDPEPTPTTAPAPAATATVEPDCDFSHIFAIGEHEIVSLPSTSSWAGKYHCSLRVKRPNVIDTIAGKTYDRGHQNPATKAWGREARPGTAEVFQYPDCERGRIVADVVRIDKGHTEGLEPQIVETIVQLLTGAEGGKLRSGG
jgi:hypothetical protein